MTHEDALNLIHAIVVGDVVLGAIAFILLFFREINGPKITHPEEDK